MDLAPLNSKPIQYIVCNLHLQHFHNLLPIRVWTQKMDISNSQLKNYIFTSLENEDNIKSFVKITASLIRQQKIVLLFTRQHVDFMNILAGLSKEQLKKFIISYHSSVDGIVEKLLQLHDWTILPDLVIINLNSYLYVTDAVPTFKKICFCISSLLSYTRSLERQRKSKHDDDGVQGDTKSVLLLNRHVDVQVQLIIDFYYYNGVAFSDLTEITNEMLK